MKCYEKSPGSVVENLPEHSRDSSLMHMFMAEYFAPTIFKTEVRFFILFIYVLYAIFSLYGCCIMNIDMNMKKLIMDDSHLQRFFEVAEKHVWSDNVAPRVVILRPPDFRKREKIQRFLSFVNELETTEYSSGFDSTSLWLRDYLTFLSDFFEVNLARDFYNKTFLGEFFLHEYAQQYRDFVKFQYSPDSSDQVALLSFQFTTSFYQLTDWGKRRHALQIWRQIALNYSDLEPIVATDRNAIVDQRDTIAPSAMQTIGWAIIAMTIIAGIFIPHRISVFYVTISLLSISLGVIGGLSLWNCDLDHISLGMYTKYGTKNNSLIGPSYRQKILRVYA